MELGIALQIVAIILSIVIAIMVKRNGDRQVREIMAINTRILGKVDG
jgi:hypothetical protein